MVENDLSSRKAVLSLPLIVAHRGDSANAPENTFAAFRRAIDGCADGIEFDVQLSRDGVPVVIHDADLLRTGGRPDRVSDHEAVELASIDVGSWFNAAFPLLSQSEYTAETIKTLSETLEFLADFPGRIYIEIKGTPDNVERLAAAVCGCIHRSPLLPQIIVKSFKLSMIPVVRSLCPNVLTAALFEPTFRTVFRKGTNIVDLAKEAGADELSIHYSLATMRLCRLAARGGLPLTIWTVDDTRWLDRARQRGIEALVTNDPGRFRRLETEP